MATDRSRISRNNKNRGRAFERDVATLLGWTRVPYSGAIKEWGGADVVDGFYRKGGYWAAECKTQIVHEGKPAHLDIKHKWIAQMLGGEQGGRHGVLIIRRIRDPKKHVGKKGLPAYVVLPEDTWDWFVSEIDKRQGSAHTWLVDAYWAPLTKAKGYNFRIAEQSLVGLGVVEAIEYQVSEENNRWYVMTLDAFAKLVTTFDLMVHEDEAVQPAD